MPQAISIIATQLRLPWKLPVAVLEAAARWADDEAIAELLAARVDLPPAVRAQVLADTRACVRAAYLRRPDLSTPELADLLSEETRASVLASVCGERRDEATRLLLWARIVARPTKGLAAALLPDMATSTFSGGSRTYNLPPTPVLVATLNGLGTADSSRRVTAAAKEIGDLLAAGHDAAAADAVLASSKVNLIVRTAAASAEHVSDEARTALLRDLWAAPLANNRSVRIESRRSFMDRKNYMPNLVDVLHMLLQAPDLSDEFLTTARQELAAMSSLLPPAWLAGWTEMLDTYHATKAHGAKCATCVARAQVDVTTWPTGPLELPDQPETGGGRGATPASWAQPDSVIAPVPAGVSRPLEELSSAELVELAATSDDAHELAALARLADQRATDPLTCAVLSRRQLPSDTAVALLERPWATRKAETIIRLVQGRQPDPAFAVAAAGIIPGQVIAAFGPSVFAEPGPDQARRGSLAFAAAVALALRGPDQGWPVWADPAMRERCLTDLGDFVAHPDVPEEGILALPWSLVEDQLDVTQWSRTAWSGPAVDRLMWVLADAAARVLGTGIGAWETYARLANDFTGSVADLLEVAAAAAS